MSAPAAEVIRRGQRLALLKMAGVRDPIRYVRSEKAMMEAVQHKGQPPTAAVEHPPPQANECPWCGETKSLASRTCSECIELEDTLTAYNEGRL